MAERAATSSKPKNGRRSAAAPSIWFVVAVESWEWGFSFGVERRPEKDPYKDYRHLHLWGSLVRPPKTKTRAVKVVLVPSQNMNERAREKQTPLSVGSLHSYRGEMEVGLSMPADVLPSLLAVLAADRVRYLVIEGTGTRARADVIDYSLEMSLTEEDLAEL